MSLESVVRLAGLGQLALAAASTAIPYVLRWKSETAGLRPLLRQLFWIYAGYILGFHIAFGLVSALAPGWLLDGSGLARSDAPKGPWFSAAEAALVSLFVFLSATYTAALVANLSR